MSLSLSIEQTITAEAVVEIAQRAARVILDVYDSKDEDWNVEMKADDSPLTRADREANAVICEGLAKLAPHVPIVSEENRQLPYDVRKNYKYSWCVDPLDGTKEFIKRNGQFTVNIALIEGDTPILGVVQVPVSGKVYYATRGQGAFVKTGPEAPPARINVKTFSMKDESLTLVGSASHTSSATSEFVSQFAHPKFEQLGSSLKLLMVAEGAAHIYPRLAPTCEWDTCAAHAIVLEAGGEVVQAGLCDNKGVALEDWKDAIAKERPLVYNKENVLNPFFVVYGRRI